MRSACHWQDRSALPRWRADLCRQVVCTPAHAGVCGLRCVLFFKQAADFFAQNAGSRRSGGLFNPVVKAGLKGVQARFKSINARRGTAGSGNDRLQAFINKGLHLGHVWLLDYGRGRGRSWRCCQRFGNRLADALHEALIQGMPFHKHALQLLSGQGCCSQILRGRDLGFQSGFERDDAVTGLLKRPFAVLNAGGKRANRLGGVSGTGGCVKGLGKSIERV